MRSQTTIWTVVLAVALTGLAPQTVQATEALSLDTRIGRQEQADSLAIYLPMLNKGCTSLTIQGRVVKTDMGEPNVPLELRFFNGVAWSTIATTTSTLNPAPQLEGNYYFYNVPLLGGGQKYYVLFRNIWPGGYSESNHFWLWATPEVTTNPVNCIANLGTFDTYNLVKISPQQYATISLPYVFTWGWLDPLVGETYQVSIYDPGNENVFLDSPILPENTSSWQLSVLPPGFVNGVEYAWDVWVYAADGGIGLSGPPGSPVYFSGLHSSASDVLTDTHSSGPRQSVITAKDWQGTLTRLEDMRQR